MRSGRLLDSLPVVRRAATLPFCPVRTVKSLIPLCFLQPQQAKAQVIRLLHGQPIGKHDHGGEG
jgi:hypothetical protein